MLVCVEYGFGFGLWCLLGIACGYFVFDCVCVLCGYFFLWRLAFVHNYARVEVNIIKAYSSKKNYASSMDYIV